MQPNDDRQPTNTNNPPETPPADPTAPAASTGQPLGQQNPSAQTTSPAGQTQGPANGVTPAPDNAGSAGAPANPATAPQQQTQNTGTPSEAAPKASLASRLRPYRFYIITTVVVVVVLAAIAVGGYAFYASRHRSPEELFHNMLAKSMTMGTFQRSYKLSLSDKASGRETISGVYVVDTDFSNIKKPEVKGSLAIDISISRDAGIHKSAKFRLLADGSAYVKFTNIGDVTADLSPHQIKVIRFIKDRWLAVNSVGDTGFTGTYWLNLVTFLRLDSLRGPLTVGKIPRDMRRELLAFQEERGLYTIKKFRKVQLDGQKVMRYEVAVDAQALKQYNKMLPAGPRDQGRTLLSRVDAATLNYVFYVDPSTELPVKVALTSPDAIKLTVRYGKFGQKLDITAPQDPITSLPGAQAQARDQQRQADTGYMRQALELYYAQNGHYPLPKKLRSKDAALGILKGLGAKALTAPLDTTLDDGSSYSSDTKPSADNDVYNYTAYKSDKHKTPCSRAQKCQSYQLQYYSETEEKVITVTKSQQQGQPDAE